ncbi:MAG: VWA domain-containing protein [Planctomycetes bacterium]|nr:VWA domain-containing protein [Planctomycetota bacterium]
MVTAAVLAALAAFVVAGAELLHRRRIARVARLAFGPSGRPATWVAVEPFLRAFGAAAFVWGAMVLIEAKPKVHKLGAHGDGDPRHLVLVLDVSPSMRLQDAGPTKQQSRMARARDVMESFFQRVAIEQFQISVIATYTGAIPVVVDTKDVEVVRNILGDLPLSQAFPAGKTDIFAGLAEAAKIARPWPPGSTTVMLVSDGDSVPPTGMPKMPPSVSNTLVVGIGDPITGRFLDGAQSRQDRSTLKQIAVRLSGAYHDGNEKHLGSDLLAKIAGVGDSSPLDKLTLREYALFALATGALLWSLLPLLLHRFGTRWQAGVPLAPATAAERRQSA